MELRRFFLSRRFRSTAFKFAFGVLFIVFAFSLFVKNSGNDDDVVVGINVVVATNDALVEPTKSEPLKEAEKNGSSVTTHFITAKFISDFYHEEGIPYDNYCQIEMESRKLRVKEICSLYLQDNDLGFGTGNDDADRKIQFRFDFIDKKSVQRKEF